jgi:serine/threonine-protein kinase TTK/MPS1
MTYGRPPFAHIQNQLSRIMAITNPNHEITFPDTGVGDVIIPPSLKGTLRKCLNRDPTQRPTVDQLLSKEDVYLHPEQPGTVMMNEDILGQIIAKVVERCRDPKRGLPNAEEVKVYPRSFMEKIREMVEKG